MKVCDFLEQYCGIDLRNSKFTFNIQSGNNEDPLFLTRKLWSGELKDWEYSNLVAWTGKRDMILWKPGTYIVQIVRNPITGKAILGSLSQVINVMENPNFGKPVEECNREEYSAETGLNAPNTRYTYKLRYIDLGIYTAWQVSITCKLGQAYQLACRVYRDNVILDPVAELTVNKFPGYDKVNHSFKDMATLIDLPEWRSALQNQKGIYMLVDTLTGKQYIGSAYGRDRIWQRWKSYLETGHGGNTGLSALTKEYIFENFKMTILERCSDDMSNEEIIRRESLYKDKFMTRQFGYNNN